MKAGECLIDLRLSTFPLFRSQILHGHLNTLVTHPVLNSSNIHSSPKRPSRKCISELVKPEILRVHSGPLRDPLCDTQEVKFWDTVLSPKDVAAGRILQPATLPAWLPGCAPAEPCRTFPSWCESLSSYESAPPAPAQGSDQTTPDG